MESDQALASIAHICGKLLGNAAVEAVAINKLILSAWRPRAQKFYDAMHSSAIDLTTGRVDPEKVEAAIEKFRPILSLEFIEEAGEGMGRYYRKAYEQGLHVGLRKAEKASAFDELVKITGAKSKNVVRTINRWFTATQGNYFDRFIVPYTKQYEARLREAKGKIGTLNKIGRDYKRFVDAEGYWDSISDFNSQTATVWAQIDSLHESGAVSFAVVAIIDDRTCVVCFDFDGNVYPVSDAQARMTDMLVMGADRAAEAYPWPRPADITGGQTKGVQLPTFHARCYAEGTEVYTNKGWQLFENLKGDELFISRKKTGELEWTGATKYIEYFYQGKMVKIRHNSFDLCVTPNHSQPFERRVDRGKNGIAYEPFLKSIEEMLKNSQWRIPRTGSWVGKMTCSIEKARFLGYYLSEGSVTERDGSGKWKYQISIAQNDKNLLKIASSCIGVPEIGDVHIGVNKIYIAGCPEFARFLLTLGKSHEKYVPDFIKNSTVEVIQAFLGTYVDGDGSVVTCEWKDKSLYTTHTAIHTSSVRMAADLGELILKVGGYPSFSIGKKKGSSMTCPRTGKQYLLNHDVIIVSWNRSKFATSQHLKVEYVDYSGMVRDVELEKNHVLWIRYNGKTSFSGNCRCGVESVYSGTGAGIIPPGNIRKFRKGQDFRGVSNQRAMRYMEPCIIKSAAEVRVLKEPIDIALGGRCLSLAKYTISDMNLGYDGEYVIRDLLDIPLDFTTHKAVVDLRMAGGLLGKLKRGWGVEVKTQRVGTKLHKATMGTKARRDKKAYVKKHKLNAGTFLLVRDEEGLFDIYFKKGFGGFRMNSMTSIGKASRKEIWESSATDFALGVREALLKAMGEVNGT